MGKFSSRSRRIAAQFFSRPSPTRLAKTKMRPAVSPIIGNAGHRESTPLAHANALEKTESTLPRRANRRLTDESECESHSSGSGRRPFGHCDIGSCEWILPGGTGSTLTSRPTRRTYPCALMEIKAAPFSKPQRSMRNYDADPMRVKKAKKLTDITYMDVSQAAALKCAIPQHQFVQARQYYAHHRLHLNQPGNISARVVSGERSTSRVSA